MNERIYVNESGQTCKALLTHEESLSANYQGPIRGPNAPKIVLKWFDLCGYVEVCEECEWHSLFCKCDDKVRDVK